MINYHKNIQKIFTFCKMMSTTAKSASSTKTVPITVRQGTIIGCEDQLTNGNPYYAFKGIPYAQPPIGQLRFKPPLPLDKFPNNIQDCTKERDVSFQKDAITGDLIGTEDCLFLNVYTPKLHENSKLLPVMVYIHGGAFLWGSGNSEFYLPLRLIEEDVIVVTLNYRLGILGFLYLPDADIPGNAGLKDQLVALKWVKENIKNFNGDPNNITLFGQSAGSGSVHLHLLSQLSQQYFDKAICQSGTGSMEWAIQKNPLERTRRLAKLMGCQSTDDKEIGKFLCDHEQKPVDMIKHLLNTLTPDERRRGLPMPFKPIVEQNGKDAIITKSPLDVMCETNVIDKPVMMGYTSKEGMAMLPNAMTKLDELNSDLARLIPTSIDIEPSDKRCNEIANQIRDFYFHNQEINENVLNELCDLLSDYHFVILFNAAAELHSRKQHNSKLYFYTFSYDGKLNMFKKWFQCDQIKGACHGDELFYLFQTNYTELPKPNSNDDLMMKRMCRMWTNFAKYGDPTPTDNDELLTFKWNPVKCTDESETTKFTLDYLNIDDNPKMYQNPDKNRVDFWKNIFIKWNQSFLKSKL